MTVRIEPTPALRGLCLFGFLAMTVQVWFLFEPEYAENIRNVMWDKSIHFLYFGTMAFLLWIAANKRRTLAVWAVVALVGGIDEWQQLYTPGRSADINDWLADSFGAAVVLIVSQRISPKLGDPTCVASSAPSRGAT